MNKATSQVSTLGSTLKVEAQLSRKVKIAARDFGFEHADVAIALIELGDFYFHEERFVDSSDAYRRALDIYEALGEGHQLLTAMAMRSLSSSLISEGKFTEGILLNKNSRALIQSYQ